MSPASPIGTVSPAPARLDWAGVALYTALAILAALFEVFLLPLYIGSVLVPISVVLAVASNVLLPRASRSLVDRTAGAVVPFVVWVVVVLVLTLGPHPGGDIIVPGGGAVELVFYGTVIAGVVAGLITIVTAGPSPARRIVAPTAYPTKR